MKEVEKEENEAVEIKEGRIREKTRINKIGEKMTVMVDTIGMEKN